MSLPALRDMLAAAADNAAALSAPRCALPQVATGLLQRTGLAQTLGLGQ